MAPIRTPRFSMDPYGTKIVLLCRNPHAPHQQTDRLRDPDPGTAGLAARAPPDGRPDRHGNRACGSHGIKAAQAAAPPGPGAVHAWAARWLSAGPPGR